ncbi:MAG: hypothetical protein JWP58_3286 [Hymenobacter sp.]|nr:hypothetical protein [Hymenobacter sp.]
MEETGEYRIVQTSDYCFMVERAELVRKRLSGLFWWAKWDYVQVWHRSGKKFFAGGCYPQAFKTAADAQKWIDDSRKYPIVVKQPA